MNKLSLKFETSMGKTHDLNIPYVMNNLTDAQVKTLADVIIAQDIFFSADGTFKKCIGAKLIIMNEKDL